MTSSSFPFPSLSLFHGIPLILFISQLAWWPRANSWLIPAWNFNCNKLNGKIVVNIAFICRLLLICSILWYRFGCSSSPPSSSSSFCAKRKIYNNRKRKTHSATAIHLKRSPPLPTPLPLCHPAPLCRRCSWRSLKLGHEATKTIAGGKKGGVFG